jgi:hypothetical protein
MKCFSPSLANHERIKMFESLTEPAAKSGPKTIFSRNHEETEYIREQRKNSIIWGICLVKDETHSTCIYTDLYAIFQARLFSLDINCVVPTVWLNMK